MSGNILYNAKFACAKVNNINGFSDEHQSQTLKGYATLDGVSGTFNLTTASGHALKVPKDSVVTSAYLRSVTGDHVAGPFDFGHTGASASAADNLFDDVAHTDINTGAFFALASGSVVAPTDAPHWVTVTDTTLAAGNAGKKVEALVSFMQLS